MILVIDNYDSFTYNLVQYLAELGEQVRVHRNDVISAQEVLAADPRGILISPGPGVPENAGISVELIRAAAGKIPVLGVCLGHQSIATAYGGSIRRAAKLMHGKTSDIRHDGRTLFRGLSEPFVATRYHSLVVDRDALPQELEISAWTDDGTIMGLRHRARPLEGVQFHPESVLTTEGKPLLKNWLEGLAR